MTNQEFIESIRLEGEEWREIPTFDNVYYASTKGRIASMPRKTFRNGKRMNVQGRVMKQLTNKDGYKYLFLRKENEYCRKFVHWLVAFTYIPNPGRKTEIDHVDTNPANIESSMVYLFRKQEKSSYIKTPHRKLSSTRTSLYH